MRECVYPLSIRLPSNPLVEVPCYPGGAMSTAEVTPPGPHSRGGRVTQFWTVQLGKAYLDGIEPRGKKSLLVFSFPVYLKSRIHLQTWK